MTTEREIMKTRAVPLPLMAVLLVVLLAGATGCASSQALKRGDAYARAGDWDAAITYYQQRLNEHPDDAEARAKLQQARVAASAFHRAEANKLAITGDLDRAEMELELAVRLDPTNQAAATDLRRVKEAVRLERMAADERRTAIEEAKARSDAMAPPVPEFEHTAMGEMTFDYRRARLQEIYRALGRLGNVNVLLDPELDNPQTSFFLRDVTYEKAWEILTTTHGHFFRPIARNTIVVAPDDQNKRRQYEPQVLRTFYLSNADPEQVAGAIQSILGARQVMADPALNAVTVRDTAGIVDIAGRLVGNLDKARGEVLLQIEIFEVDRGTMDEWGLSLSDYGTTLSVAQSEAGIALSDLDLITNQDVFITIPSVRYQFLKQDSSFRVIAQPQLRASDGQATSLLVGEQRPVITTTFNPQNTSGGDVIPIASTEYRDVGIKVEATPRVHHDGMITLQLGLEVTAAQEGAGVQGQPIFTARTLTTTLRLMEGETNLLAGLLRDDERTVLTGFPLLSQVPVLKELFSKTKKDITQTDIVMAITPHIVRMADLTEEDMAAVYVGTENSLTGTGSSSRRGGTRARGAGGDDDQDGGEPQPPADPVVVSVEPATQTVSVGQRVRIQVQVQGNADINNAGMRVGYNAQVLRYIDAEEGGLLSSDGNQTSFQTGASAAGSVALGLGRIGNVGGVRANGTLVTIEFEAISAGASTMQVVAAAIRDPAGRPLPAEFESAEVIVRE